MKAFTQVKSFARMKSACVFSFGLLFLIHSISQIKNSSSPRHFFITLKFLIKLSGVKPCTYLKSFPIRKKHSKNGEKSIVKIEKAVALQAFTQKSESSFASLYRHCARKYHRNVDHSKLKVRIHNPLASENDKNCCYYACHWSDYSSFKANADHSWKSMQLWLLPCVIAWSDFTVQSDSVLSLLSTYTQFRNQHHIYI